MRLVDVACSEIKTTGTLTRAGFWVRQAVNIPLIAWIALTGFKTVVAWPAAIVAALLVISSWGRRLHDRGHSAWWLLVALIPGLGLAILVLECGLRPSSFASARFQATRAVDYLSVLPHTP